MKPIYQILQNKLDKRIEEGLYRKLENYSELIDFSSNDYLGFSFSSDSKVKIGATGSRLISGNSIEIERLELEIAAYHKAESGLIFNSGYVANLGLFSTIPQRGDTVIYDELIHASIRDGIKLSNADSYSFMHNDLLHLEEKLKKSKGNIFVAIESVYSMDGDSPDLKKVVEICNSYNANLIIDEAHAVGVVGEKGEGLVASFNLEKEVFATIITFGKALGCHGAIVIGNNILRDYLINFCRPFIYTTAPSTETITTIQSQYKRLRNYFSEDNFENKIALELKAYFIEKMEQTNELIYGEQGNILSVVISGNENARKVSHQLKKSGLFVKAILSPTVPIGKERLRICFHSFNTINEVNKLIDVVRVSSKNTI